MRIRAFPMTMDEKFVDNIWQLLKDAIQVTEVMTSRIFGDILFAPSHKNKKSSRIVNPKIYNLLATLKRVSHKCVPIP